MINYGHNFAYSILVFSMSHIKPSKRLSPSWLISENQPLYHSTCILQYTIANMLFNLGTIVLKAELVNMWHAKDEYAISEIMAIVDHTSLNCWHCHSIIIIHGKEWVESLSMFSWFIFPKPDQSKIHYSLLVILITHYLEYKHPNFPKETQNFKISNYMFICSDFILN
jgi:uncharacterized protein with PQ loop repeat